MAGLDNIPQKTTVEIEIVKLDENVLESIKDLNQKSAGIINEFGQIYLRKKEIQDELTGLDEFLQKGEDEFKSINFQLKEIVDALDDKYPQSRINLQDGTIQYQPGAPTRKQQAEQQANPQAQPSGMKVVKQ
jgi:predicted nuclease with TOPRIM domain